MSAARKRIAIITGSGPDAGIDLWNKLLRANRARLGARYRGDLDAPYVHVLSVPELGLSMELERHHDAVWSALSQAVTRIGDDCDYYAIACNTLNYFDAGLRALPVRARLVSFRDCVTDYLREHRVERLALLGARPIMELGAWSHYAALSDHVRLEPFVPAFTESLHQLIYTVKRDGVETARPMFRALLDLIESETVLLACTELPLLASAHPGKRLLDVTDLVAARLARLACGADAADLEAR